MVSLNNDSNGNGRSTADEPVSVSSTADARKRFRRIYLHIGLGKTGSTAIQKYLLRHADRLEQMGFLYPRSFCRGTERFQGNHSPYLSAMFESSRAAGKRPRQVRISRTVTRNTSVESLFRGFRAELEASTADNLILSAEGIGHFSPKQLEALFAWLGMFSRDIRVIACLRHPCSALSSEIQQRLKIGRTLAELYEKPPLYNLQKLLGKLLGEIGPDNITLYDFEQAKHHSGGVEAAFAERLGLELPPAGRHPKARNASMSLQAALVLNQLNRRYPPLPDGRRNPRLEDGDLLYFMGLPGRSYRAPEYVRQKLDRRAAAQLQWLEETFGLRLERGEAAEDRTRIRGWWYGKLLGLRAWWILHQRWRQQRQARDR